MHNNTSQIRAAILKAWPQLPPTFHARQLTIKVYRYTDLDVYPDTILHALRMMRLKGLVKYECVNRQESKYVKG